MTTDIFKGVMYSYFKNYSSESINKLVKIKASSTNANVGQANVLINPNINRNDKAGIWQSRSEENSSVTITLLRERLMISSYSLRSRTDRDHNNPYEWVLEGSNDRVNWETLHHKPHGNEFMGRSKQGNWPCTSSIPLKYFKLTQLHENYHKLDSEKYMFSLSKIELFGTRFPNEPITCNQRKRSNANKLIGVY